MLSDTTAGQLVIENATSIPKTLTIAAQGPGGVQIAGSVDWNTRIFEIIGTGSASVTVVFKEVGIAGGKANDGGVLGGNEALGGGILIDGGQVTMSSGSVVCNAAATSGAAVGPGGSGGDAHGGGIYLATGQLTVRNSQVYHNSAVRRQRRRWRQWEHRASPAALAVGEGRGLVAASTRAAACCISPAPTSPTIWPKEERAAMAATVACR